jgi:hypothetical protein
MRVPGTRSTVFFILIMGMVSISMLITHFAGAQSGTETSAEREYPITQGSETDGGTVQIDTYDLGGNPLTKTIEFVQDITGPTVSEDAFVIDEMASQEIFVNPDLAEYGGNGMYITVSVDLNDELSGVARAHPTKEDLPVGSRARLSGSEHG